MAKKVGQIWEILAAQLYTHAVRYETGTHKVTLLNYNSVTIRNYKIPPGTFRDGKPLRTAPDMRSADIH
jgi:hypothetical protein